MDEKQFKDINEVTPPHEPEVLALTDIARQLTIIADQGDKTPNDKTWELVQALIKISKAPCISRLSGDPPEDFQPCGCASCVAKAALGVYESTSAIPAPDALVEAVKVIANSQLTLGALKEYAKSKGIEVDETDTFMSIDRKIAFDALAAHEKAGG